MFENKGERQESPGPAAQKPLALRIDKEIADTKSALAAQLAVFFSHADPSINVEAHYTLRKNVKKHPDSAIGEVDSGEDLIRLPVKLNLDRLTELLSNQVFPIQR